VLQPGPGVGGHCIAVDPWFLVDASPDNANLIRQARLVNDAKPNYIINKIKSALVSIEHPVIACLGLSFKANIDDLRESPAVFICEQLVSDNNLNLMVVEPHITELPNSLTGFDNINLSEVGGAIAAADVVLLLVDHADFEDIPSTFSLEGKVVIDTRGQWRQESCFL